jgi:16S rRNA G1207 methylase RsmC
MPSKHPAALRHRQDLQFDATVGEHTMKFTTTHGLFSPRELDYGSVMLLDYIDIAPTESSLDVGCGYGVLGMTLAKRAPQGMHTLIDKDYVAVDYTRRNLAANNIKNAEVFLSNGLSEIGERQFDVIVSNLPAKVGNELFYLYFYDALHHLKPGGRIYVVTINGLREFIKRSFIEVFGNYDKLKQGKTYTVSIAQKSS